ncbi:MAG: GtrA family protein [Candidatus Parcubacteria bacterium]|nr:GtrA family protein [Candidatus Parcubacteria bacterium]
MLKKIYQHQTMRQFVRFCLVGLANTFVDFLVYLFFSRVMGLYYLVANIISVFVAMSSSFIFNKYWTFKNTDNNHKVQLVKFTLVNIVYFLLNNSIVFSLVHFAKIDDLPAKVVAVAVGMFWNFGANKLWTFRKS